MLPKEVKICQLQKEEKEAIVSSVWSEGNVVTRRFIALPKQKKSLKKHTTNGKTIVLMKGLASADIH